MGKPLDFDFDFDSPVFKRLEEEINSPEAQERFRRMEEEMNSPEAQERFRRLEQNIGSFRGEFGRLFEEKETSRPPRRISGRPSAGNSINDRETREARDRAKQAEEARRKMEEELKRERARRQQAEASQKTAESQQREADRRRREAEARQQQASQNRNRTEDRNRYNQPPRTSETPISKAYSILGLTSNASVADIKSAQKFLLSKLHPDLAGGNESHRRIAEAKAKEINEAFHVLKAHLRF